MTTIVSDESNPQALPYQGIQSKTGYYNQYPDHSQSDNKVTKFFQYSVTTLSFLAFGGYLLFLVVAAVKGNHFNQLVDPTTTQIMQAMINAGVHKKRKRKRKRKKLKKKKRKPVKVDGYYYGYKDYFKTDGRSMVKRAALNSQSNVDYYYDVLSQLCAGYVKYTQYNKS